MVHGLILFGYVMPITTVQMVKRKKTVHMLNMQKKVGIYPLIPPSHITPDYILAVKKSKIKFGII